MPSSFLGCYGEISGLALGANNPLTITGDTTSAINVTIDPASLPDGATLAPNIVPVIVVNGSTAGTFTLTGAVRNGYVYSLALNGNTRYLSARLAPVSTAPAAIPTLSETALALMALLLTGRAALRLRGEKR